MVADANGHRKIEVVPLPKEEVVDTNGAGDSFVGGFISGIYDGLDVDNCVKRGNKIACEVVKRSGCTFPENFSLWCLCITPFFLYKLNSIFETIE